MSRSKTQFRFDKSDLNQASFVDFLHCVGCYRLFRDRYSGPANRITSFLKFSSLDPTSYLSRSFTWADTPEGFGFWSTVQSYWFRYLHGHITKDRLPNLRNEFYKVIFNRF